MVAGLLCRHRGQLEPGPGQLEGVPGRLEGVAGRPDLLAEGLERVPGALERAADSSATRGSDEARCSSKEFSD